MSNNHSLVRDYLDYQIRFEKEYGPKSIVLMQLSLFIICIENRNPFLCVTLVNDLHCDS